MEKREVVCGFLFPANEDAAEAVHPAVRALDYPAAGLVARLVLDEPGFLTARFDVGREAELLAQLADFVVVVALVQAQVQLQAGFTHRRNQRHARERFLRKLEVVAIGGPNRNTDRNPAAFRDQRALRALLRPIHRRRPGFFPRRAAPW